MMRSDDSPAAVAAAESSSSSHHRYLILSDRDRDHLALQEQHNTAVQLLGVIDNLLRGADGTLGRLEADSDLLPNAILRGCTEFADLIGSLAHQLEQQSPEDRERLAGAIQDDARRQRQDLRQLESNPDQQDLLLSPSDNDPSAETSSDCRGVATDDPSCNSQQQLQLASADGGLLNQNDVIVALAGAATLLRDVEAAFRDVGKDEAEEISDVALTLARLFLISLQNIHSTLTPHDVLPENFATTFSSGKDLDGSLRSSVLIEELPYDEDGKYSEQSLSISNENGDNEEPVETTTTTQNARRLSVLKRRRRLRVLWPRLGPHVETAMEWTKEGATKRPLLAAAIGLTLWPVAITTAVIGGGVVLADGMVQDAYDHFQKAPLIDSLEQGAAQAYQACRLALVTGKLVAKQSFRVASRQIERQGGLGHVLDSIGSMALNRLTHPIETVGMVWDGLNWGVGAAKENIDMILAHRQEEQVAQQLQS